MIQDENNKSFQFFAKMVDELVMFASNSDDQELKDGIKWLDEKAQKEGITFYKIVFRTLYKHGVADRAKAWQTQSGESVIKLWNELKECRVKYNRARMCNDLENMIIEAHRIQVIQDDLGITVEQFPELPATKVTSRQTESEK